MGLKSTFRQLLVSRRSGRGRPAGKAARPQLELSEQDIAEGCLLIRHEAGDVVKVAIQARLVERIGNSAAAVKCELPILLACRALDLPGEKIEKILANRGSHNVKTGNASKFHSTYHWGNEEVYFVQILSTYL